MSILVVGESCNDIFHYGLCNRLCPEAPVPVFNSSKIVKNGGMAMNVYNNLSSLGSNVEIYTNTNWKIIKIKLTYSRIIRKDTKQDILIFNQTKCF